MQFEFVKHSILDNSQLQDILRIKESVWLYPHESHLKWIEENILNTDYHLLVYDNGNCVAYLNLVDLNITSGISMSVWGIGNVCVKPERQGENLGLLLMKLVDYFIAKTSRLGVLICKDKVSAFYERCNWMKYKGQVVIPNGCILPYNFYFSGTDDVNALSKGSIIIDRVF